MIMHQVYIIISFFLKKKNNVSIQQTPYFPL